MAEEWISMREYARRKGVSDTTVRRAVATGKIIAGKKGKGKATKINPPVADAEWSSNLNPMYGKISRSGIPLADIFSEPEPQDGKAETHSAPKSQSGAGAKSMAEIKKKTAEVRLHFEALKLKKMQGKLVDREQVYKALFLAGQEMRTKMQAVPDRVIDDILAARSRPEAHATLYNAIADVLEELSEIYKRDVAPTA